MADVIVKDHPGLVRDQGGFIKNTDKQAFLSFIAHREKRILDAQKLIDLQTQIDTLTVMVEKLVGDKK